MMFFQEEMLQEREVFVGCFHEKRKGCGPPALYSFQQIQEITGAVLIDS